MKTLFIITARGGSKGIPNKNIKHLQGKALLHYSIEYARKLADDKDICLSTNDELIVACAQEIGLDVPFIRPNTLAQDHSSSIDVLKHALTFYEEKKIYYDALVLLQPTSPFRKQSHFEEAFALFTLDLDMVVSVKEPKGNPYFTLFEEDELGYLHSSKESGSYLTRQQAPKVYEYNGALYIINTQSLKKYDAMTAFPKIKKYVMESKYSIDLDTPDDWDYADYMFEKLTK